MTDKNFVENFREVIRDELVKRKSVQIDGLGTFRVKHEKQRQQHNESGQVVLLPPRDIVQFISEER